MAGVQGYRLFNVQLARKSAVSPSLLSLVFTGSDVSYMKCDSPDQRIKLLLPSLDGKTPYAVVPGYPVSSAAVSKVRAYNFFKTGKNHSLLLKGAFNAVSLVLTFTAHGAR